VWRIFEVHALVRKVPEGQAGVWGKADAAWDFQMR